MPDLQDRIRAIPGVTAVYRPLWQLFYLVRERWWSDPEARYRRLDGSWSYDQDVEQGRFRRVLAVTTRQTNGGDLGDVLEVGCAGGTFTSDLASVSHSVTASDISVTACDQARRRCAGLTNVSIERLDITRDRIPGTYDVVFAMDVLDCLHDRASLRRAVVNLVQAMREGGLLVVTVCHLPEEVQRVWWLRTLARDRTLLVRQLDGRLGLMLIHVSEFPDASMPLNGYQRHRIALYRKGQRVAT